jgi:hypothetical protein
MARNYKFAMLYRLAANAVAIFHLLFIVFVVLGGLLVLHWRRLAWVHLPAAVWGAVIEIGHWSCPLTSLENTLLRRAGAAGYPQGFLSHYMFGLIYPGGLTRGAELVIAVMVTVINVVVYRKVFH